MFDIDSGKLLIVAVLALIVIGPKDLPRVLRQMGQMVGKLRRMSAEFQGQFMDAIKEAELDDIRKDLKDLERTAERSYGFDPTRDIRTEMTSLKADVTSALQTVGPEAATLPSPAGDFTLPAMPDEVMREAEGDADQGTTTLAEGIAPVAVELLAEPDDSRHLDHEPPKRKLFVKPHRSRFARLNSDRTVQLTGQAISVRQRLVRSKKAVSHDVLSS